MALTPGARIGAYIERFFCGGAAMYAPSRDGQRFLVIRSLKAGGPGSIRVVLNAVGRQPCP